MREFGLWNVSPEELAETFPEMRHLVGQCRFGLSCTHANEPGCAIQAAVKAGQISLHRYESYLRLREG
jgi:ribosome biogenesis GTPase